MSGGGKGGGGSQVVGYRYYMGIHLSICHGPVDAVKKIEAGDRQAWSGNVTTNSTITVSAPDLFGGDKKEGGIVGDIDVLMGGSSQGANSYLAGKLTGLIPYFRGVLSLVYKGGQVCANNPYIKPWAVTVKRITSGWSTAVWNSAQADIGGNMNPAHIIYECLTNSVWGMGYPTSHIDTTSFSSAAATLYAENFGLSMIWNQQDSIENFIGIVLDHIGGILHENRSTGRFNLKLIRDDYSINSIPQFDETNIVEMKSYQRAGWGETTNEVTVNWTDAEGKNATITVQDLANITAQGGVVSQKKDYPGIRTHAIAKRVALRDLIALATPLAKISITTNRDAWDLLPGDVFKLVWPNLGIDAVAFRIMSIDYGTLHDGKISIEAAEDIFGLPESSYVEQEPTGWAEPSNPPAASPYRIIAELPYWDIATKFSQADQATVDAISGFVQVGAVRPTGDATGYDVYTDSGSGYKRRSSGAFVPTCTLTNSITRQRSGTYSIQAVDALDTVSTGTYAVIGTGSTAEYIRVDAIDLVNNTLTASRGVLDTTPAEWGAGTRIYFLEDYFAGDPTEYSSAASIDTKILPTTGQGTLAIGSAPVDNIILNQRQYRPYPPGLFAINGSAYPASASAALTITWAHRDRLQQTATIVAQSSASIGPEAGTTYNVRIYDGNNTLLNSTNTASTSYNYLLTVTASLLHFEGADASTTFTDDVGNAWTRVGNAQIDTAQFKFGTASGLFDGTGDYLSTPSASWNQGTSDFTIETWVRLNAVGISQNICMKGSTASTSGYWLQIGATNLVSFSMGAAAGAMTITGTTALTTGAWYHVAAVRAGNVIKLFINGVLEASMTLTSTPATNATVLYISRNQIGTDSFLNGWLDEFRFSLVARYSANFTPPTSAFSLASDTPPASARVEVESVRGGLVSWQSATHTFAIV